MSDQEPVRIILTPEQREQIQRISGQYMEAIDIHPEEIKQGGGQLRLHWRPSLATGIPRQVWQEQRDGES